MTASEKMLSPLEAAYYLGITTELLFQYTKSSFTRASGLRSLETSQSDGRTFFAVSELDAFDALLAGRWPQKSETRPAIPTAIVMHLRAEACNQCIRCASGVGVDTAHIIPWSQSRSHHHANLIRICSACHREHDAHNSLSTADLKALKTAAVEQTRANLISRSRPALEMGIPTPRATHFFGRKDEQEELVDALRTHRSILITGVGGIGKTELLLRALRGAETGRPVLWIDVEQYKSARDVQSALLGSAGTEGISCSLAELPARLDNLRVSLVFDGIERASLADIDELEALIAGLQTATSRTQTIMTSQAMLYGINLDRRIEIERLDGDASRSILGSASGSLAGEPDAELLGFCDGHALTLRIASALMEYYGSAAGVMGAIRTAGPERIRFPGRSKQDRQSSLDLCLNSAYAALDEPCRRLLWLLAEAPAGIGTFHLEQDWHGIADPQEALAELRRWHLVGTIEVRENFTRTHMLSPVRAFATARARADDSDGHRETIHAFVFEHAMLMAALAHIYAAPNDTPHLIYRFREELPNLLHCIELARLDPSSHEISEPAVEIASALMRYFFVTGLCHQGAKVMHVAAKLALDTGQIRRAIGIIPQLLSLAHRAGDDELVEEGRNLAEIAEHSADGDAGLLADIAMSRAIAEYDKRNTAEFEWQARLAYERYCVQLRTALRKSSTTGVADATRASIFDDLHNSIANALALLGDAWLEGRQFKRAAKAYDHALRHGRGDWVAVNGGQTRHQLGNCRSSLGEFAEAADCYRDAARIFHYIRMEQYLSNALAELGLCLLDFPAEAQLDALTPQLIDAGLSDLERDLRREFDPSAPLDHARCNGKLRKLAGMVILASLLGHADGLGHFCSRVGHEILDPMGESWLAGERDSGDRLPLGIAQALVMAGLLAANGEREFVMGGHVSVETLDAMLENSCKPTAWVRNEWRLLEWLSVLLTRRWGYSGADAARLHRYADNVDKDVEDPIELNVDALRT